MEDHIDEVEGLRAETREQIVQPEREHCEGPITLMALFLLHRRAPKVIPPQVAQWRVGPQVLVVPNSRDVVEDEVAIEGIPKHGDCEQKEERVDEPGIVIDPRSEAKLFRLSSGREPRRACSAPRDPAEDIFAVPPSLESTRTVVVIVGGLDLGVVEDASEPGGRRLVAHVATLGGRRRHDDTVRHTFGCHVRGLIKNMENYALSLEWFQWAEPSNFSLFSTTR